MGREKTREGGERRGRTLGQEGWAGVKCRELSASHYGAEFGAVDLGAELDAVVSGAELPAFNPGPNFLPERSSSSFSSVSCLSPLHPT